MMEDGNEAEIYARSVLSSVLFYTPLPRLS
jgi:hypothetical protein